LEPAARLVKVNTDAEPNLANQFNIRTIPTLALFKSGREITRQAGAIGKSELVRWVRAHT
jgi:thioredoxin 2